MAIFRKWARRLTHKNAPRDTIYQRRLAFCRRLSADLAELGYGVRNPRNLRGAHLRSLVGLWRTRMSAASARNMASLFRALHEWSGSPGRLPTNEQLGLLDRSDPSEDES